MWKLLGGLALLIGVLPIKIAAAALELRRRQRLLGGQHLLTGSKDGVIDFWYSENDIPSVRYEDAPYNAYCEYCKNEVDSLDIDT